MHHRYGFAADFINCVYDKQKRKIKEYKMNKPQFIVVLGNIKGGTGKSTLAMHLTVSLLYRGLSVSTVDLDGRQGSFSRYLENRKRYIQEHDRDIPTSDHLRLSPVLHESADPLKEQLNEFIENSKTDVVLIDTPGNDSLLSGYAHSLADVLITPLNDSFIDLDVLVNVKASVPDHQLPLSVYAAMIWQQRMQKAALKKGSIEWLIVRNRMHSIASRNRLQMDKILLALSKRIGFHLAGSIGERIIFRELFDLGLTVLDKEEKQTLLSHISARQEIRVLTDMVLKFRDKKDAARVVQAP
jgi:chromosome partitioning protein